MISPYSKNYANYQLTSEVSEAYQISYDSLFSFLKSENLVYTFNEIERLTQKAIKLGATYRITKFSKDIIWPKNCLDDLIKKYKDLVNNQNIELLNNSGIEYLYHMTHIDNLSSILENGLYPHANNLQKIDISDCDVNSRRSRLEPIFAKSIHSYVPFYFNPKNAMLYVRRNIQNNIVILKIKKELLLENNVLFTDGNASCVDTNFFDNLVDLDKLNWQCINDNNWCNYIDGRRIKMSEVLVPDYVSVDSIEGIICNNTQIKSEIEKLQSDIDIYLDNRNKFYF